MSGHEYHVEPLGFGAFIVLDEFGHPALRHSGSLAQFASAAVAAQFAAQITRDRK